MQLYKKIKRYLALFINRMIPAVDSLEKRDLKKIRKIVSEKHNSNFRIKNVRPFYSSDSYEKTRKFHIIKLSNGKTDIVIFVKSQKYLYKRASIMKDLSQLNLPIPNFYGEFMRRGNFYSIWRYYHSNKIINFSSLEDHVLANVAEKIACFNVVGTHVKTLKNIYSGALWSEPVAKYICENYKLSSKYELQLKLLVDHESDFLSILNEKSHYFLNHNDIKESNIMLLNGIDEILLSDFDTLSFGPLGVSLRKLSFLPIERRIHLVKSYTDSLYKLGVIVCDKYIHQMMFIQQVFWGLHTGITFNQVRRIERALELLKINIKIDKDLIVLDGVGPIRKVKPPVLIMHK